MKVRISEAKLRNMIKKAIKETMEKVGNGDIYDMERWKADGSLKLKEGQIVSDEVIEHLRDSMPPTYDGVDYFQPGEAYSHDWTTGRALYLTFKGNKYIGLKPNCSLWAGKESLNESVDMQLSKTILSQLGGNMFVAMTGAKDFVAIDNGLKFRIGRNKSRANVVRITLDIYDTYTMEFWSVREVNMYKIMMKCMEKGLSNEEINEKVKDAEAKSNMKLKEYNGLYFDQLQEFFTEYTGLYTRL